MAISVAIGCSRGAAGERQVGAGEQGTAHDVATPKGIVVTVQPGATDDFT